MVALSGMPALNRYLKANHLREGILKIFVILFIVGSFAVPGPTVSLVKVCRCLLGVSHIPQLPSTGHRVSS